MLNYTVTIVGIVSEILIFQQIQQYLGCLDLQSILKNQPKYGQLEITLDLNV